MVFLNPQPSDKVLTEIYSADYFLGSQLPESRQQTMTIKRQTARLYLDAIRKYCGLQQSKLLEIGCGNGEFLLEAAARGFKVHGLDISPQAVQTANAHLGWEVVMCGTFEQINLPAGKFDLCVCVDVIEHLRDPMAMLAHIRRVLKPDGVLLLVTPAFDSFLARLMRQHWFEFKTEHLHYFSRATLQNALARAGFHSVQVRPNWKILTLDYLYFHFKRFPSPGWSSLMAALRRVAPRLLRTTPFIIPTGNLTVLARAGAPGSRPLLSVIMPVYNEKTTFITVMNQLVAKELVGMDKEIIIVESNSNDGTRDDVLKYQGLPGVHIVLSDKPRGKGYAVREGLPLARGGFILIQDADLEYDVNDYDALLKPLCAYRRAFVLGSRHLGDWKIRDFGQLSLVAMWYNLGHIFFTTLFNWLYRQKLNDPWTMYKVFRRDCLHGLKLECNRFDFDVELVTKLVRKGFTPLEIPVNYVSRSFEEGKKINTWSDPWTWLWAIIKYRFVSPYEKPARIPMRSVIRSQASD